VSAAGDINGDGYDDILVGSPLERYYSGIVYVIFGRSYTIPFNDIDVYHSITNAGIGFQVCINVNVNIELKSISNYIYLLCRFLDRIFMVVYILVEQ